MKNHLILDAIAIKSKQQKKQFAVLIDPDNVSAKSLNFLIDECISSSVDYFFVGGSLMNSSQLEMTIQAIKHKTNIPVILFPGSPLQIHKDADALLFLSLISGRNPELLIGHHVIAAPYVKAANLEVLPTGYMLIDSGAPTTASYMSSSNPIPHNKPEIAACTALAGEYLGLKMIYMDGGSGAKQVLSSEMINQVKKAISVPLVIGGGINTKEEAVRCYEAGADVLVVGNYFEKSPEDISIFIEARDQFNT